MKYFIFFIVLIFSTQCFGNDCHNIKDNDLKYLCLSRKKNHPVYCNSIKNQTKKQFCLAIVKNEKNYCYSINNEDFKNYCLAMVD